MVQEQYTTKREKGKHLTLVERGKIEALLKMKMKKRAIAKEIGISERTLHREIKRGTVKNLMKSDLSFYDTYVAEYSQKEYERKQGNKEKVIKIEKNYSLLRYIEKSLIEDKNSVYVALERAKKEEIEVNICEKTVYNYIKKGLLKKVSRKDMPYKKRDKGDKVREKRIRKSGGRSIEERKEEINKREEIGHWEMDTVVGKKGTLVCLLVLTERKSRLQIIRKLKRRTKEEVVKSVGEIIEKYPGEIKTITSDNGSEFMDAKSIERYGISYFYSHIYSSWERGSNENNNKLIRRHISKGIDIGEVSEEKIRRIEEWMNDYPRKLFNGKTSREVYLEELTKIS